VHGALTLGFEAIGGAVAEGVYQGSAYLFVGAAATQ
jgi:hypothetical protein